jgi:hypothetical protein
MKKQKHLTRIATSDDEERYIYFIVIKKHKEKIDGLSYSLDNNQ